MNFNITLVGYRAVGKSTVGHYLAKKLHYACVCADKCIEQKIQMNIFDFVQKYGWKAFRKIEEEIIAYICKTSLYPTVIVTGGGAVTSEKNISELRNHSTIYWLKASIPLIKQRLQIETIPRPSLLGNSTVCEVEEVLKIRTPLYKKVADYCIDVNSQSIENITENILKFESLRLNIQIPLLVQKHVRKSQQLPQF